MKQLSGQDGLFVHAESPGLPLHILGVTIYDPVSAPNGECTFEHLWRHFESRIHLARVFCQRLVEVPMGLDQPYWIEDASFQLESHLHRIQLPAPGNWQALCDLVGELHALPLDRSRPLWMGYVIEGLDDIEGMRPGCFAVVLKAHHAAMDGISGVEMYMAMHDTSPEGRAVAKCPPKSFEDPPSTISLLGRAYMNNLGKVGKMTALTRQLWPAYRRVREGRRSGRFSEATEKPHTRFNGKVTADRVVGSRRFKFETLAAIKRSVAGATINDVMLAVVSGGLRRYLQAKGELPEQSLVSGCPVNVRADRERGMGGNAVGFMNVSLCSDIADPRQRLIAIQRASAESKEYRRTLGERLVMELPEAVPAALVSNVLPLLERTGLLYMVKPVFNTVVTNVPGLPLNFYLGGARVVGGFGAGPLLPNVGLFHTVTSNVSDGRGEAALSFAACPRMLPDPIFYANCLQDSFDELVRAVVAGREPLRLQLKQKPERTQEPARRRAVHADRHAA
jgi:WS/DGAT/MGAT family acyltransferase